MESLMLSQKSFKDVKDPVLKGLVTDIRTILQAGILQASAALEDPEMKNRMLVRPAFQEFDDTYSQLNPVKRQDIVKLTKKFNTQAFRNKLSDLGIDLKNETPASEQADYQKIFNAIKGKEKAFKRKIESLGRHSIVPFSMFPDPDVSDLIEKIKRNDKEAEQYADYLALLNKDKLIELYEREVGKITDKEAFFEAHEPSSEEITKIRRTTAEWQRRAAGDPAKYKNSLLRLVVSRVLCIDETEHDGLGEGVANDRIDFSAISLSPDGQTSVFGPQIISDNFQDDRHFYWNREIARFNLLNPGLPVHPLSFGVTVTIAEIDYGAGFANAVGEMWRIARPLVIEAIKKIGEALGAYFGSAEAGRLIGQVLGELFALALGELVSVARNAVIDDVFDPLVVSVRLDSKYSMFTGSSDKYPGPFRSPEQEMIFNGFGGTYRIYFYWELKRVLESGTPEATTTPSGQVLRITTQTANDDLRGYNTAFFSINYTDGSSSREYLLHRGHGATQISTQDFQLDSVESLSAIRSVTIRYDGGPQWFDTYDNWDLMSLEIALVNGGTGTSFNIYNSAADLRTRNAEGNLFRFTGHNRTLRVVRQR